MFPFYTIWKHQKTLGRYGFIVKTAMSFVPCKGPSITTYAIFFWKTNISNPLIRAYMGVRNVSFSVNFAYILNGWHIIKLTHVRISSRFISLKFRMAISCFILISNLNYTWFTLLVYLTSDNRHKSTFSCYYLLFIKRTLFVLNTDLS